MKQPPESPDRIQLSPEASARLVAMMQETDEHNALVGVEGEDMAVFNLAHMRETLRQKRLISDTDGSKLERLEALATLLLNCDLHDPVRTQWWRDQARWALEGGRPGVRP